MIIMRRGLFIMFCIILLCCTGCDWVRTTLGLKSKDEIAAMEAQMKAKAAAEEQRIKDSLAMLAAAPAEDPKDYVSELESGGYYLILGSFEKEVNVERMKQYLKLSGFTPVVAPAPDSRLTMVGVGPYSSYSAAARNTISMSREMSGYFVPGSHSGTILLYLRLKNFQYKNKW